MLSWRLLMSAILVPSLVALFWFDHSLGIRAWLLLAFCCLVAVRNSFELTDLLAVRSMRANFPAAALLSLLIIFSGWVHVIASGTFSPPFALLISLGAIGATMIGAFCILLMLEAWRYDVPGRSMESLGANLITVLYSGGLLAFTAQMRWFPDPRAGYFVIASMIICVKSGDTMAYTFGRLWGKRKMAPKLSPGKTWMGLIGALFGSMAGGWLWLTFGAALFQVKPVPAALWIVLSYSASIGLVGLIGDLCESLIKRDVQKKDSAALMPGFGGLLDLLDSPLFAGPFALAWWHLLPPATFG
jgi:phosphatidate cytidylyltransferase